jgi:putative addiction module component (TIGR02574 family)
MLGIAEFERVFVCEVIGNEVTMSLSLEQILEASLSLPDDERLELAEALVASVEPSGETRFDESLLAEVRRRSAELDAGTVSPIPWSVVKQRNQVSRVVDD